MLLLMLVLRLIIINVLYVFKLLEHNILVKTNKLFYEHVCFVSCF